MSFLLWFPPQIFCSSQSNKNIFSAPSQTPDSRRNNRCNETRKIIFSTCPEPTVSPVGNPSPGAPSRAPVLPTSTAAPVLVPTPPITLPTLPTSPQAPPSPTPGLPTVCAAAALRHAAVFLSTTSSMLTTFFLDPCTNKGPNWHICADHTFWRYCEECDFGTVPIRLGSC